MRDRVGVQPVLQDVEVEGRERYPAELQQAVVDHVVLVVAVGLQQPRAKLLELAEGPAVDLLEGLLADLVAVGGKSLEVAQQVAERVADLAVGLGVAVEGLLGQPHVLEEVDHRDPQPEDLGAAPVGDVLRRDRVAKRLGHLAALAVEGEAVGHHLPVRRAIAIVDRDEQRGVEPAAVLVVTLEVDVGRPGETRVVPEHGGVRGAGLEPYVDDVLVEAEPVA